MKICVIGGAGYIGSHVVYELIRDGHEIIIIDNLSTGQRRNIHEKAIFYQGDITKKNDLIKVFKKECALKSFDLVMHFAAKSLIDESINNPLSYYHNNVEGVRIMLEVITKFKIKNLLFSSTSMVYGTCNKDVCEEDDILRPINPYGETKFAGEKLIKWVCKSYNMNYGIFRYFNVAGADESLKIGYNYNREKITHLIPIIVETALGIREKLMIFGDDYNTPDGTCIRDYLHVTDLARAHVLGAKYLIEKKKSFLVNLGANTGYSVKEIISETEKLMPLNYEIAKRRVGDPDILISSNKRAKEILGWKPQKTIRDIIKSEMNYKRAIQSEAFRKET